MQPAWHRSWARWTFSALALLLCAVAWTRADNPRDWPPSSDVEADPALTSGTLENGFRYALLPRSERPGVVSLRLVVEVGSLDERAGERGLAHFVEHMAFEGTRSFGSGELVDFFQRLGMSFGVDVNAFTYHDKTVYHLELPQSRPELIDEALKLYRDYADGMLFPEDRLENQREVILREKLARETPSGVIDRESFDFAFKGARLAKRDPMGEEWAIQRATRKRLLRYYNRWYRPDLMTLVAVGDFDPQSLTAHVERTFGSLETPRSRPPKRRMGRLRGGDAARVGTLQVDGVERFRVEVSRAWEEPAVADSWAFRRQETLRGFATSLLNERCRYAIDGFSGDYAFYYRVNGIPYSHLLISSGGKGQDEAVLWIDRRIREALTHGFRQDELDRQRSDWLRKVRASELRYETLEPRFLADDLVDSVVNDRVFVAAARYRSFIEDTLSGLSLEQVNRAFAEAWDLSRMAYFLVGPEESPLDDRKLRRLLADDREEAVAPFPDFAQPRLQFSDLGAPGTVVETQSLEELGATTYRFANNARLNLMRAKHEKGMVRALVRVGGGLLSFTDSNPATHALAMPSLFRSGVGDHGVEEVYAELRSEVSSFFFGVDDHDAFSFRVVAPADGLGTFLSVVAEYLLQPEIRGQSFSLAKSKLLQARSIEADGINEGYRELARMLYPNEPRFHAPTAQQIASADLAIVRDWLERQLRDGYVEVSIIGDLDVEKTVGQFASTLGALPKRDAEKPAYEYARSVRLLSETGTRRIVYPKGKGEGGASVVVWTLQGELNERDDAALTALAAILENRIRERVRDGVGKTYSPQVVYQTFSAYPGLRHIRVDVDCEPGDVDWINSEILRLASDLRENEISADELSRAILPLEESMRLSWNENVFILEHALFAAHEYPELYRRALTYRDGLLATLRPAEIRSAAERLLTPETALAVSIAPDTRESNLAETPSNGLSPRATRSR